MFSDEFKRHYFRETGLDTRNRDQLLEAYNTAHRIREFEIELYRKRTANIWAMQAALIGIVLFLRTGGDTKIKFALDGLTLTISTTPSGSMIASILLTSTLAFFIAMLWRAMTKGAKFWQNNWERHVDILGEQVGQNLYQVYPIEGKDGQDQLCLSKIKPFSVTKINGSIVCVFIAFWIFNIGWGICDVAIIFGTTTHPGIMAALFVVILLVYVLLTVFACRQFTGSKAYRGLKMSDFGQEVYQEKAGSDGQKAAILVSRRRHK